MRIRMDLFVCLLTLPFAGRTNPAGGFLAGKISF
jgi:hypothetical protein